MAITLYNNTNIAEFGLQTQTEDKLQMRDMTSKASSVQLAQRWTIEPLFVA